MHTLIATNEEGIVVGVYAGSNEQKLAQFRQNYIGCVIVDETADEIIMETQSTL